MRSTRAILAGLAFCAFLIPSFALAESNCADGVDNDGDLLIDCADDSCDAQACDDGAFCTVNEVCDFALTSCTGSVPLDCSDGIGCTDDSCDDVGDVCVNAANDANCDDAVGCTDDTCDATLDCQFTANDANCDDGAFCNGAETCDATLDCQAGTPPAIDDGVACTDDSCDEVNDVVVNAANDANCDDAVGCTDDTCDATLDCQFTANDANCDDGAFCNGAETCDATLDCQAGTPPAIDDGVACTDDSCDEVNDVVINAANDANCDDGAFCNGSETCDATLDCQAGTPPAIDDGVACTDDACDEVNDVVINAANDANCDDGAFCNGSETCDATLDCQAGTPPAIDDGVACTDDSCDEVNDVVINAANDANCDDGAFCNGSETCDATLDCQAGTPPAIDDGVACTDDSCDEVNDVVINAANDANCDDGAFCNGAETCDATLDCQAGTPPAIDDGVACTDDSCDEVNDMVVNAANDANCDDAVGCTDDTCDATLDCQFTANDANCDDGAFCNGAETCDATLDCQAGTPPAIDDGVACTDDTCDEVNDVVVNAANDANCDDAVGCTDDTCDATLDCQFTANDANCDDGAFCNGAETCDATLDCQAGTPPAIDDGVACTDDSCDEVNDVVINAPNDTACDDLLFCNGVETCDAGTGCQPGTPVDCSSLSDACQLAACDETLDGCVVAAINEGLPCDDGDPCTPADICVAGECTAAGTTCGDGIVDIACGEECDPPSGEICNNLADDDVDGLVDCLDPDCDELVAPTCDGTCRSVSACKVMTRDPGKIRLRPQSDPRGDMLKVRGKIPINPAVTFPVDEGFSLLLSNADGEVYRAELGPGDLRYRRNGRYLFRDRTAKQGASLHDGLFTVAVRITKIGNAFWYAFRVKAFADLSAASLSEMTLQVSGVDDVASRTDVWTQTRRGWRLTNR